MCVCVCVCVCGERENSQIGQVGISHNEPCREKKGGSREEGRRPESEGEQQSESDGDGLGARDKAPKEQLQELQRRCSPSPQAWFHKAEPDMYSQTHTHTHKKYEWPKKKKLLMRRRQRQT